MLGMHSGEETGEVRAGGDHDQFAGADGIAGCVHGRDPGPVVARILDDGQRPRRLGVGTEQVAQVGQIGIAGSGELSEGPAASASCFGRATRRRSSVKQRAQADSPSPGGAARSAGTDSRSPSASRPAPTAIGSSPARPAGRATAPARAARVVLASAVMLAASGEGAASAELAASGETAGAGTVGACPGVLVIGGRAGSNRSIMARRLARLTSSAWARLAGIRSVEPAASVERAVSVEPDALPVELAATGEPAGRPSTGRIGRTGRDG